MRWLTVSRCFGAALLLALLAWPLGMLWVLSHEDYHPEPGTLDYYLGLSSLVRGCRCRQREMRRSTTAPPATAPSSR